MDRLGRYLEDLIELVSLFWGKGVEFISLKDGIDTRTATGRFTFNIFASLAEFEREIIKERTMAVLEAAKARGKRVAVLKDSAKKRWPKLNTTKFFMKVVKNQFRKSLKD